MANFYEETTAVFEAKKTSVETKIQDEDDQIEDPDVIKMAVRFDKYANLFYSTVLHL